MNCILRKLQSYTMQRHRQQIVQDVFWLGSSCLRLFTCCAKTYFYFYLALFKSIAYISMKWKKLLSTEAEFHWCFWRENLFIYIFLMIQLCVHCSINNARNRCFVISLWLLVSFLRARVSCVAFSPFKLFAFVIIVCAFQINNDKIIINYFAIFFSYNFFPVDFGRVTD